MKKSILIISLGLLGFTFNVNAQNKTEKPVLANSSKNKVDTKKTTTEKSELKTAAKATTKIVKGQNSNPKKNNTSDTPKLGAMSKKEEK